MFRLSEQDNGLYFFRGRASAKRCPVCGQLLDKYAQDLSQAVIAKRPLYDVSSSGDGVLVVSKSFRGIIASAVGLNAMRFGTLPRELYTAMPQKLVSFDYAARKTRFERQCAACGQYESVIGATPVFLKEPNDIGPNEVARTDLEFGSNDEKSPVILFGHELGAHLMQQNLSGLELVPC